MLPEPVLRNLWRCHRGRAFLAPLLGDGRQHVRGEAGRRGHGRQTPSRSPSPPLLVSVPGVQSKRRIDGPLWCFSLVFLVSVDVTTEHGFHKRQEASTSMPPSRRHQRRALVAAAAVVVLGLAACCALIAGMTAGAAPGRVALASLDEGEEKVRRCPPATGVGFSEAPPSTLACAVLTCVWLCLPHAGAAHCQRFGRARRGLVPRRRAPGAGRARGV